MKEINTRLQKNWYLDEDRWSKAKEILENPNWKGTLLKRNLPGIPSEGLVGVYLITSNLPSHFETHSLLKDLSNVLYVGKGNLKQRFNVHSGDKAKKELKDARRTFRTLYFNYLVIDEEKEKEKNDKVLRVVEQTLIDVFGPPINSRNEVVVLDSISASVKEPVSLRGRS